MGKPYITDVKVLFEQLMIQLGCGALEDQAFVRDVLRQQFGACRHPFFICLTQGHSHAIFMHMTKEWQQTMALHLFPAVYCKAVRARLAPSMQRRGLLPIPAARRPFPIMLPGAELPQAVHVVAKQCGLDWEMEASGSQSAPESPCSGAEASVPDEEVAEHSPAPLPRTGSSRRKGVTPTRLRRSSALRSESLAG